MLQETRQFSSFACCVRAPSEYSIYLGNTWHFAQKQLLSAGFPYSDPFSSVFSINYILLIAISWDFACTVKYNSVGAELDHEEKSQGREKAAPKVVSPTSSCFQQSIINTIREAKGSSAQIQVNLGCWLPSSQAGSTLFYFKPQNTDLRAV